MSDTSLEPRVADLERRVTTLESNVKNLSVRVYALETAEPDEPPATEQPPAGGAPLPGEPVAFSPAPGSSGTVLLVGPSRTHKTLAAALAAAKDGDTIRLDAGVYKESLLITKAVVIDGGGKVTNPGTKGASYTAGAVFDYAAVTALANGKGGLVPRRDCVLRGLEIKGAGIKQTSAQMTSAIRNEGAGRFTVEECWLHDNQCGIGSGGYAVVWSVKNCLIRNNGLGDGYTHNVYLDGGDSTKPGRFYGEGITSIVDPTRSNTAFGTGKQNGGHALKLRTDTIEMRGSNYLSANDGTPLDVPSGTAERAVIANTTIEKPSGAANHRLISYAPENQNNGSAGMLFTTCTLIASCPNPFVYIAAGTMTFENCSKTGNAITKQGAGNVVGL